MAAYTSSCTCLNQLGDILGGSALWLVVLDAIARAGQQLIGEKAHKYGFLTRCGRLQGSGGLGLRLLGEHQQNGGTFLDGALKAEPVGSWQTAEMLGVGVAEVERDDAKAARMQQQISGAHGMVQLMAGADPEQALKGLAADAGRACAKEPQKKLMPWETAPAGRFVVLSQSMKDKDGKEIKSANKNLDAGIAVGLRYIGLEARDTVQSTTIFRCE